MNKRNENVQKRNKAISLLRKILLIISLALLLIYLIKGGLYSLLFDLRESKSIIVYSIIMVFLLISLILLNIKDEPENESEKKLMISSYITVGVIILIIVFGVLLVFTLIDFFLPIIVFGIVLALIYFVIKSLINNHYVSKR